MVYFVTVYMFNWCNNVWPEKAAERKRERGVHRAAENSTKWIVDYIYFCTYLSFVVGSSNVLEAIWKCKMHYYYYYY